MTDGSPIDAFVFFADPDGDRAAVMCRAMRQIGLRVVSDNILGDSDSRNMVFLDELHTSRAVVVLISARWGTAGSEEVDRTVDQLCSVNPSLLIIPVVLDGASARIPFGLQRLRAVPVAGDNFAGAATAIAAALASIPVASPPAHPIDNGSGAERTAVDGPYRDDSRTRGVVVGMALIALARMVHERQTASQTRPRSGIGALPPPPQTHLPLSPIGG